MAYNDDAVLARLSSLNESHDSIATAAQWIMFHRRHADRTVQLWVQRLKDSSSTKRLSLMYLANEVAQQSRIRHKEDFIIAFSPVIAEAAAIAYKGAPTEVQGKLRRVFEVWRDRSIFEGPIQRAIESRLDELDKSRGAPKGAFGGAIFGSSSSVPSEFAPLVSAHLAVAKLGVPLSGTISSANQEYEKQTDAATEVPSAPVYAARLNGLLKTLASAENAVAERVKARQTLVTGLEKLLETNRQELDKDHATVTQLSARKTEIEEKKQQVELAIMRALGPAEGSGTPGEGDSASSSREPDRPPMEALTPPAMEALTPPAMEALTPPSVAEEQLAPQGFDPALDGADAQAQNASNGSSHQSVSISANGSNKRRRVDDGDFPDLGGDDGIDEDVAAMLKT